MKEVSAWLVTFVWLCSYRIVLSRGMDLPSPAFTLNLTQDESIGVEKRVFRRLGAVMEEESTAPLFEGLGTHYSFIWVGSPAQRVSVIMDTGSHHTAFPCTGCKCGKHMDPYFDPSKSTTSTIKSCGNDGKKCYFKQSYTEGSSWSAYKVKDKVWVGGPHVDDVENGGKQSIDFEFGCQESETGLFRTQKVDGIMGLSVAHDTLPFKLHASGITNTKMFALCFRTGGGVVTLGGVDTSLHAGSPDPSGALSVNEQNLHSNRTSSGGVYWVAMLKPKGWYTVRLLDVLMRSPSENGATLGEARSIGGDTNRYSTGKGTIVDSGTTDTYLPSALRQQFVALFRSITGKEYANKQMFLTKEQFRRMPVIVFRLMAVGGAGGTVDLEVKPSSYMEFHKDGFGGKAGGPGKYTPRIYMTEGSGAVLGANAINEHNVIFDPDNLRVGFARSTCTYGKKHGAHDFATSTNGLQPPSAAKGKIPIKPKVIPPKPSKNLALSLPISVSKVPLQPAKEAAFKNLLLDEADRVISSLQPSCQPLLSIPCNARCDHNEHSMPIGEDNAIGATVEYVHFDSAGVIRVSSAAVVHGQQFWRIPVCDQKQGEETAIRRMASSMRTLQADAVATEELSEQGTFSFSSFSAPYKTEMQVCSVACSLAGAGVLSENRPVRFDPVLPIEDDASSCDPTSHSRKQLLVNKDLMVTQPEDKTNTLIFSVAGQQHCLVVMGAATVSSNSVGKSIPADTKCHVASIAEVACKPFNFNCTSSVRHVNGLKASVDAVSTHPADIMFTVHLKVKGLSGGVLSAYQEADIINAFATIFKLHQSSVSIAAPPFTTGAMSFGIHSLGGGTIVRVFLRFNLDTVCSSPPAPETASDAATDLRPNFHLPESVLGLVTSVSGYSVGGVAKAGSDLLHRQLLRDQVQQYLHYFVTHTQFPALLATTIAKDIVGNTAPKDAVHRPIWLTSTAISAIGVSFMSGRVDSTSVRAAEKLTRDSENAEICANMLSIWNGWKLPSMGLFLSADAPPSTAEASFVSLEARSDLIFIAVAVLGVILLLGFAYCVRRRYLSSREALKREGPWEPSTSVSGVGSRGEDDMERGVKGHPTRFQGGKDRRRKVLQKISLRK